MLYNAILNICSLCHTDVCDINKNGCEHRCVESDDNVVSCECNEGWKLHDDGKNCEGQL